ncbi:hypothetical protein D3C84_510660 [compost metagenome]
MQDETLAVAAGLQIVVEGGVGFDPLLFEVAQGFFVEAQNIAQHAPESRRQQIASLGEKAVEVIAVVLETAVGVGDRKAHLRGFETHTQLAEQANEVGVGPVIENDKPGIHRITLTIDRHVFSVRMPAKTITGLKQGDLVSTIEQIGAGQA